MSAITKQFPVKQFLVISAVLVALVMFGPAMALDANADSDKNESGKRSGRSMDDVAKMIRKQNRWEILKASPRQRGSVTHYRFKLYNKKNGKVKILSIDPNRPNLRKLE